jgi:predicted Ser/Thr protein kinase
VGQPPPKENSKTPKSLHSSSTSSRSEGDFIAGTILDRRYRITGLLGRGGMGEVYKAEDLKLNQTVALKFLPEDFAKDKAALERFYSEVRIARQVSHPNVCRVFDIGEVEGSHFLSMEFIDGDDLSSLLRRIGRLPPDKAVEIARQLCAGLHAIHQAGVLHRDLKPANAIIDGRGRARITDFGIAGLESELKDGAGIAGTPAYMSPEQITGKEVTTKSDIYSLGLVLYEIFTGRQAFEADTINELIRKHQTATPTNPSEHVKDIDPLVEQIIFRCLEKDPRARPASALQVAMSLPGGNPLEAAIAAGETPSPEMVAAAPKKGALKPVVAVACLASVVALFAFVVFFSGRVMLSEWIPLDKSPDALAERGHQIINKLGYIDAPKHKVYSFDNDDSYIHYATREDAPPDRFERIRTGQPLTLYFWYRTSPRYLVPNGRHEVGFFDPPNDVSGMTRLALDVRGRLIYFEAVPPRVDEQTTHNVNTDWSTLFAEAGLDIRNYKETELQLTPPIFADERKAWEGKHIDQAEIPVHIEAAAFHGKPLYFNVVFPWDMPSGQTANSDAQSVDLLFIISAIIFVGVFLAAIIVARYNLKAGRGDIKGAFKLGVFIFSAMSLAQLIDANHVPELGGELSIFLKIAGVSFVLSIFPLIFYIALEPFVRRRWSELIISWSRLMTGDFRDPLVGRDILVGGLLGLCNAAALYLGVLLPQWTGIVAPPLLGSANITEPLSGVGGQTTHFLFIFAEHIFYAIANTFLLLLLLTILRKKWLAIAGLWLILFAFYSVGGSWVFWVAPILTASLMTIAAARFGLLALYSFFLFSSLIRANPITSDFSSWYAGSTIFVLVALTSLAVYGFYTSLAGQPLLKRNLLHD